MAVSVNVSQNKAIKFDLDHLPATHTKKGDWFSGIAPMLMGAVWAVMATTILVATGLLWENDRTAFIVFPLVFASAGILLFLSGLNTLFKVTTTTIDKCQIAFSFKSLFRSKQWVEDLERYEGILYRDEYHSGGKNQRSFTLYIVELYHTDKDKVVILHQSTSSEGMREIWEDSCRKLNLPAVEKDGSSLIKRDVEDLDKSVRDLVKEGKISIHFDPSLTPPKGLKVNAAGDIFQVILTKDEFSLVGNVIALMIPGVIIWFGFAPKGGWPFLIVGIIIGLLMLQAMLWSALTKASIRIGEETLILNRITPWGETAGTTIKTSEIESVVVRKIKGYDEVLIKTDQQQVAIGRGLSVEALQWLKNCILTIIAT